MIVKAPFKIPEPPIPASARPRMNIFELWAMPEIREPNSKRTRKERNVYF
jgi:hypothetical protein